MDGIGKLIRFTLTGLATYIPGLYNKLGARTTGGSDNSAYCYNVWIKHIAFLQTNGMTQLPRTYAELGPGDSLGVCFAALLCGAEKCYALDTKAYGSTAMNLKVFDEIVALLRRRAPRPSSGWPVFDSLLDERLFPSGILSEAVLETSLREERVRHIRHCVESLGEAGEESVIEYIPHWESSQQVQVGTVDLLLSHSVLEHVVDLAGTYAAMASWVAPGGWMSHQVDLSSHGLSEHWNGYRSYSEATWALIMGKRLFLINRAPMSWHQRAMDGLPFAVKCLMKNFRPDALKSSAFARRWRTLSDEDALCSGFFMQAMKSGHENADMG